MHAKSLGYYLQDIKFTHSIFALPFAFASLILSRQGGFGWQSVFFIVFAMFFARSFAMGANRYLDREFDSQNKRTKSRMIPRGLLKEKDSLLITCFMGIFFIVSSFGLNQQAGFLSVPLLFVLGFYSYMKRISIFTHFYLGMCLGLVPSAVLVALGESLQVSFLILGVGIMCWVGGFDVLYALQDIDFDRKKRLKSIPARLGEEKSLFVSVLSFVFALLSFVVFGILKDLSSFYYLGLFLIFLIFMLLCWCVSKSLRASSSNLEAVVFSLNSWVGVIFLFFLCLDRFF